MFKAMRRNEKKLTEEEALAILATGEEGVLATVGADNYPYAIPLNYAFHDGCIYFHCAPSGHKLDNIRHNPKVSFCVVGSSEVVPAKFSTKFESVVLFGIAEEVAGVEKKAGLDALIRKYAGNHLAAGEKYIQAAGEKTRVFRIRIAHLSGKGAR
ncbi:MAG: pyridoxamine 5'-phosphate oxidase family protein [Desulfosarcinaceae bacterium]|jgi:nitroimidazol reductase NimA-like FMN-containing flavoprotein (pyridoxamine 5'-phosphate oxidase superfamily)